jgi:oligopeptide/dipeptide ABC transporter ATP-binding protein
MPFHDAEIILNIDNFSAGFCSGYEVLKAVDNVSFNLHKGETLGIVGESGCGKSVTALSIMKLLPVPAGKYLSGRILYRGSNILQMEKRELSEIRGSRIAMIFQEPMTALNPVQTTGKQLAEVFHLHRKDMKKNEIFQESIRLLERVGIPEPEQRLKEYPHQLSGGMRQRVMIAMALACSPDILIADEPTTALDVTIQAQILDLIKSLQSETGMSVIFITHDLGVIAALCDNVIVMYAGRIAESGSVESIFSDPMHPYTRGLLDSIPKFEYKRKSRLKSIEGMVPSLSEYPEGCRFQNRCPLVFSRCYEKHPDAVNKVDNHVVYCYKSGENYE